VNFNKHYNLIGKHAFLSASKYHWINYDEDHLKSVYLRNLAVKKGTELHDFAQRCIHLGQKLPRSRKALNQYVNDAIGFRMTPEQILFYSLNSFGSADAISFRNKFLRIHDLKTGKKRASMHQLEVYAALFCLEYECQPNKIDIELRIYQNYDVSVLVPDPIFIREIMDKIIHFDKKIEEILNVMED
jgi:hypothetical protein